MNSSREKSSSGPAWSAAIVSFATLLATIAFHSMDQRAAIHERMLQRRQEAVFSALHVIDLVYSNEPLGGQPPVHPIPVDLQAARDAYNDMLVYCGDPDTVIAFRKALGMHGPREKSPGVDLQAFDEFRKQVAKELELRPPVEQDPDATWIYNLDGAK